MKEYSRGSEWRRWDLHIHTASSYDAYKGDDSDKLLADAINKNELAAIQQHICDILEGGEKAFEKRKNKYNLKN